MSCIELFEYDAKLREGGVKTLCGVDEAGRGPLAGPVSCAAVVLPEGFYLEGLNDSKKLSEARRDELFDGIIAGCVCFKQVFIGPDVIDEINILQATMKGMREAVEGISVQPDLVLIDGNRAPELKVPARCVIKADALSASVAAASIIAKVARDRYMKQLDELWPQYEFARHKGYPTKRHYELIERYGITDFYRKSFLKGKI